MHSSDSPLLIVSLTQSQHLFSRLPVELRWKIWSYNLPGLRIVSVRCGADPISDGPSRPRPHLSSSSSASQSSPGCTSPAPIPANLHACHESRREALRWYRPSFGLARQPGRVFFDHGQDILYFGPRDGFMASDAQLRTFLSLCDPGELAQVTRVALNDALFWVYGATGSRGPGVSATCAVRSAVASSLLFDVLGLLRAKMPGLRAVVFVPRDENPLYSQDCCLVEPSMIQSRLTRQVREAVDAVFGSSGGRKGNSACPWEWKIMTLSADPDPPVYNRQVLGWDEEEEEDASVDISGSRSASGGRRRHVEEHYTKAWTGRGVPRLGALQESVRRQFVSV